MVALDLRKTSYADNYNATSADILTRALIDLHCPENDSAVYSAIS